MPTENVLPFCLTLGLTLVYSQNYSKDYEHISGKILQLFRTKKNELISGKSDDFPYFAQFFYPIMQVAAVYANLYAVCTSYSQILFVIALLTLIALAFTDIASSKYVSKTWIYRAHNAENNL